MIKKKYIHSYYRWRCTIIPVYTFTLSFFNFRILTQNSYTFPHHLDLYHDDDDDVDVVVVVVDDVDDVDGDDDVDEDEDDTDEHEQQHQHQHEGYWWRLSWWRGCGWILWFACFKKLYSLAWISMVRNWEARVRLFGCLVPNLNICSLESAGQK